MEKFKIVMQNRLLELSRRVIIFTRQFPDTYEANIIKNQLIRCVTSVGANYHAACRAKSRGDFIYKLHIVEEECDESIYWVNLIGKIHEIKADSIQSILSELNQIMAIIVSSLKTMKGKQ
ncbi:MAG: four helix bundle protein [Bacteroidales bacterium]